MIPDEAVEAAEEALMAAIACSVNPFMPTRYLADMGVRGIDAAAVRKKALTAALEAAAPHMESAWHDAVSSAYVEGSLSADQANIMWNKNPYRTAK